MSLCDDIAEIDYAMSMTPLSMTPWYYWRSGLTDPCEFETKYLKILQNMKTGPDGLWSWKTEGKKYRDPVPLN